MVVVRRINDISAAIAHLGIVLVDGLIEGIVGATGRIEGQNHTANPRRETPEQIQRSTFD
jgi:hypothetical protein